MSLYAASIRRSGPCLSQRTAYFHLGDLVEVDETAQVFTNPQHKLTEDYITGRFG